MNFLLLGLLERAEQLTDQGAAPTAVAGTVCLLKAVKALKACEAKSPKHLGECKSLIR